MSDTPGFVIDGEHYPYPETVEFGDTILIRRLTGLSMQEYSELDDEDTDTKLICLVGMAVRHKHPKWSLDKVTKLIEQVDFEKFEVVGEDTDADPPAVNGAAATSPPPSTESTGGAAEPSSDEPPPDPTGIQA